MNSISTCLNRKEGTDLQRKWNLSLEDAYTFLPPLTSLPSLPPFFAWSGEEGRPPPAASKRQRAHQPETLGPSQTPSKLQFLHPILHHPSPVSVGCSLGLRANKHCTCIILSVEHSAFPVLLCLPECLLVVTVLQTKTKAKLFNNAVMASW